MEDDGSDGEERAQAHHLKKRARKNKSVVVVFDEDARKEYLTGFRKRKNQRRKAAEAEKEKKDRQKRLLERKERRQALQEAVGGRVQEAQAVADADEIEPDEADPPLADSVVYTDGDTLTTVTTSAIVDEEDGPVSGAQHFPIGGKGGKAVQPKATSITGQLQKQKTQASGKQKQKHVSHNRRPLKSSKRKRDSKSHGRTPAKSKRRRK